jgi:hypothetical protein
MVVAEDKRPFTPDNTFLIMAQVTFLITAQVTFLITAQVTFLIMASDSPCSCCQLRA